MRGSSAWLYKNVLDQSNFILPVITGISVYNFYPNSECLWLIILIIISCLLWVLFQSGRNKVKENFSLSFKSILFSCKGLIRLQTFLLHSRKTNVRWTKDRMNCSCGNSSSESQAKLLRFLLVWITMVCLHWTTFLFSLIAFNYLNANLLKAINTSLKVSLDRYISA